MNDCYNAVYYNGREDVMLASGKPLDEMMKLAKSVARKEGMKPEADADDGVVALYVLKKDCCIVKAVGVVKQ